MKKMFVVLEVLKEHGPLSSVEIGEIMGMTGAAVRDHLYNLQTLTPKVVYIHSYRPSLGYGKGRGGPLWSAGDLPNAHKPVQVGRRPKAVREDDDEDEYSENRIRNEIRNKAKNIKPFRDPMLFMTAGVSP